MRWLRHRDGILAVARRVHAVFVPMVFAMILNTASGFAAASDFSRARIGSAALAQIDALIAEKAVRWRFVDRAQSARHDG